MLRAGHMKHNVGGPTLGSHALGMCHVCGYNTLFSKVDSAPTQPWYPVQVVSGVC